MTRTREELDRHAAYERKYRAERAKQRREAEIERDRLLRDCATALERIAAVLEDVTDRGRVHTEPHSVKV